MRYLLLLCMLMPMSLCAQKTFQLELYKHVLKLTDDKSYITFFHDYQPKNQITPALTSEESGDIIIEGNLSPVMGIIRPDSTRSDFFQRLRISVPVNINIRLTNGDSSPMTPPSNQVGFKMDYALFSKCEPLNTSPLFFLTSEVRHYSNGQGPGSLFQGDATGNRNDYAAGDFSTNYLRNALTYSQFIGSQKKNLISARAFYQRDFHLNDVLQFLPIQNGRYGKNRIGFVATYEIFSNILANQMHQLFPVLAKDESRYALSPIIETEIINIMDNAITEETLSIRVRVILGFDALNGFGLLYQYYQGRDYLNIRYDLPIKYHSIGLHFRPF